MYFPCIILAILENNKNLGYEDFRNSKIETRNENRRFIVYYYLSITIYLLLSCNIFHEYK